MPALVAPRPCGPAAGALAWTGLCLSCFANSGLQRAGLGRTGPGSCVCLKPRHLGWISGGVWSLGWGRQTVFACGEMGPYPQTRSSRPLPRPPSLPAHLAARPLKASSLRLCQSRLPGSLPKVPSGARPGHTPTSPPGLPPHPSLSPTGTQPLPALEAFPPRPHAAPRGFLHYAVCLAHGVVCPRRWERALALPPQPPAQSQAHSWHSVHDLMHEDRLLSERQGTEREGAVRSHQGSGPRSLGYCPAIAGRGRKGSPIIGAGGETPFPSNTVPGCSPGLLCPATRGRQPPAGPWACGVPTARGSQPAVVPGDCQTPPPLSAPAGENRPGGASWEPPRPALDSTAGETEAQRGALT